jgi:hypothetical protein
MTVAVARLTPKQRYRLRVRESELAAETVRRWRRKGPARMSVEVFGLPNP